MIRANLTRNILKKKNILEANGHAHVSRTITAPNTYSVRMYYHTVTVPLVYGLIKKEAPSLMHPTAGIVVGQAGALLIPTHAHLS